MFDFRDYTGTHHQEKTTILKEAGSIEEDISLDIDNLFKNRFDRLYVVDRFKRNSRAIDIIYPKLPYPGRKLLIKGPDHIRFLLSLYPHPDDFDNVDKIVLRPRYIEAGSIELLGLYLRRKKILVLYLHHPFFYSIDSKFRHYAEFMPLDMSRLTSGNVPGTLNAQGDDMQPKVPPLWYIISLISHSDDGVIDKFFLKRENGSERGNYHYLNEISFFYSRHGY